MSSHVWKDLAGKVVCFRGCFMGDLRLGRLLGFGGSGAVYDFYCREDGKWVHWDSSVIKILNPDSAVARQEDRSVRCYEANARFSPALLKLHGPNGILTCGDEEFCGKEFHCYIMRKGKTLSEAVRDKEPWLKNPGELMHLISFLIFAIGELKDMGLGHGDIKASNILLVKWEGTLFPMLADYGTISDKRLPVETVAYKPKKYEYAGKQEKLIAYDLYCLCQVIYGIYEKLYHRFGLEDDPSEAGYDGIEQVLRIMRDDGRKAFTRLRELMDFIAGNVNVPAAFFLDAVPRYELPEDFPFETVLEWGDHPVLRARNALPGERFDPVLLMKIPENRYDEVYKILTGKNDLVHFVLPICRYYDRKGNEYVLIHAPDDWNKRSHRRGSRPAEWRIQDASGVPHTLEKFASEDELRTVMTMAEKLLSNGFLFTTKEALLTNMFIAPKDIWFLDGRWKLNLFSVNIPDPAEKKTAGRGIPR